MEGRNGNELHPEYYAEERHFLAFREIISATFPRCLRAEIGGHAFVLIGVRHPSAGGRRADYETLFREHGFSPREQLRRRFRCP